MGSLLEHNNQPCERNHYDNDCSRDQSDQDCCLMLKKMLELQAIPKFASVQFRISPNKCNLYPKRKDFSGRSTNRSRDISHSYRLVLSTQGCAELFGGQRDMVLFCWAVCAPLMVFSSVHTRSGPFRMASRSLETQYITGLTNYTSKWISRYFIMRNTRA